MRCEEPESEPGPEPGIEVIDGDDDGDDEDDDYHKIEDYVWEIPEPEVLHVENGSYMVKVLPRLLSNLSLTISVNGTGQGARGPGALGLAPVVATAFFHL